MRELHCERGSNVTVKALSRIHIAVHRLTRGRLGRHWDGRDVVFITTTGRRTGRPHTTPLACIDHRDGVAVVASNGGSCRSPDWWLNLQCQPLAEIELAGTKRTVRARIADVAEQEPLANSFGRAYPRFERYRRRSRRFMPVVVLTAIVRGPSILLHEPKEDVWTRDAWLPDTMPRARRCSSMTSWSRR